MIDFIFQYSWLIIIILVVLILFKLRKKKNLQKGNIILLLGECGSGKTSLLYQVCKL